MTVDLLGMSDEQVRELHRQVRIEEQARRVQAEACMERWRHLEYEDLQAAAVTSEDAANALAIRDRYLRDGSLARRQYADLKAGRIDHAGNRLG